MKKWLVLVSVFVASMLFTIPALASGNYVDIIVDGSKINFPDQRPFIDNKTGRTYVPVRFVAEALGAKVNWIADTQTAVIEKEGKTIKIRVGSNSPTVNNDFIIIDAPAMLVDSRTVVPLRFVSEVLGASVEWDGALRSVIITYSPRIAMYKGYILPTKTDLDIEKTPDVDKTDIKIRLTLRKPLAQQQKDLFNILNSKFSDTAGLVCGYVETKSEEGNELPYKRFITDSNDVITVASAKLDYYIYISVMIR